jgi:hypothetical protein
MQNEMEKKARKKRMKPNESWMEKEIESKKRERKKKGERTRKRYRWREKERRASEKWTRRTPGHSSIEAAASAREHRALQRRRSEKTCAIGCKPSRNVLESDG